MRLCHVLIFSKCCCSENKSLKAVDTTVGKLFLLHFTLAFFEQIKIKEGDICAYKGTGKNWTIIAFCLTFQHPTDSLGSCEQSCVREICRVQLPQSALLTLQENIRSLWKQTDRDQSYDYKDWFSERVNEQVKQLQYLISLRASQWFCTVNNSRLMNKRRMCCAFFS